MAIETPIEVLNAYQEGRMSPEDKLAFESDIQAGVVSVPEGFQVIAQAEAEPMEAMEPIKAPAEVIQAYHEDRMTPEDRAQFESDIESGRVVIEGVDEALRTPEQDVDVDHPLQKVRDMKSAFEKGFEGLKETFTGEARKTASTEAAGDWNTMPEMGLSGGWKALGVTYATVFTDPEETAEIIKANFPELQFRIDEKGNHIFTSNEDGKEYTIKPGFGLSDVPRAVTQALMYHPAAKTSGGVVKKMLAAGATGAGIQAGEQAAGGEFDLAPIGFDIGAPVVGSLMRKGGRALRGGVDQAQDASQRNIQAAMTGMAPDGMAARQAGDVVGGVGQDELNKLYRGAAQGNKADIDRLVNIAEINPEVLDDARRLGFDLPADIFAEDKVLRNVAGQTRAGSAQVAGEFEDVIEKASTRADDLLDDLGVVKFDGRTSVEQVSVNAREAITGLEEKLRKEAGELFTQVRQSFDDLADADFTNTKNAIDELSKGRSKLSLSPELTKVMKVLEDPKLSYRELEAQKRKIFQALTKKSGEYKDGDIFELETLYDGLREDQFSNVARLGDDAAVDTLKKANKLTVEYKDLQDKIVAGFGEDGVKSIGGSIIRMLKSGSGGDSTQFNKMMKIIPPELRKETLMTAISSASMKDKKFNFNNYAKLMDGLKANPTIYKQLKKELGSEGIRTLNSLLNVSNYVSDAIKRISPTGKALTGQVEEILESVKAEGLVEKLLGTKYGKLADKAVGEKASSWFAGSPKERVAALGKVFNEKKTRDVLLDLGTQGSVSDNKVKQMVNTQPWRQYLNSLGVGPALKDRTVWVKNLIRDLAIEEEE